MKCSHCGQAIKGTKTDSEDVWRARLALAFDGVDLEGEMVKAKRWIMLHPDRKFTRLFFERWLSRADVRIREAAQWTGVQMGDAAEERRKELAELDLMPRRRQA